MNCDLCDILIEDRSAQVRTIGNRTLWLCLRCDGANDDNDLAEKLGVSVCGCCYKEVEEEKLTYINKDGNSAWVCEMCLRRNKMLDDPATIEDVRQRLIETDFTPKGEEEGEDIEYWEHGDGLPFMEAVKIDNKIKCVFLSLSGSFHYDTTPEGIPYEDFLNM